MNANLDLDRRLSDFYASEAPQRAPDRVLLGTLAAVDSTTQRRVLIRAPWRFPTMNSYAKFAIAAVAVIAIGAVGLSVLRPSPITGPAVVAPSSLPSPAPSNSPLALTERFDSDMHGISVSYPAGWTAEPATVSWQTGQPGDTDGARDTIDNGSSESSFIGLASQPLAGRTGSEWASELLATPGAFCRPPTEGITVAGEQGVLAQCSDSGTNGLLALVWDQTRGYWIVLYRMDDRALFDQILGSVELRPGDVSEVRGTATNFVRPFDYVLPVVPQFDSGAMTERYFEVRVPDWAEAGHPGGLIAQAVGGGRADRCDAASAVLEIDPGPRAVFDYLATIPQLTITNESPTAVDGRPAVQATVAAADGTADCPELHVWTEEGEPFITQSDVRLIAVDVDGEPVVVTIYGETGNPEWPALADQIVESIDFQSAP
jgi:hypothetical protein